MEPIYTKEVSKSESKYEVNIIEKSSNLQSSYNLPQEFFDDATSEKIIIEKEIPDYPRKNDKTYVLNDNCEFKLGPNILWLIGDEFDNDNNKFVISRYQTEKEQRKPQIYKHAYEKMEKQDPGYKWFVELFKNNISGNNIVISVNNENERKIIIFDIDFNSIKEATPIPDSNLEHENANELINKYSHNRIFFGAPGTGKSYILNEEKNELLNNPDDDYERVTFHPDYSYANFVGTYKPVPKDDHEENEITYEYVPGPFMRVLIKSLKNPDKPYLLIIEEINRANVAAVFGDVFQLLDRDQEGDSEYPIQTSEDMKKYLEKNLESDCSNIRIPKNMFIWSTMNSADQGVYMMDTAFKRRWNFCYIGIDEYEGEIEDKQVILGKEQEEINWNDLRKAINHELLRYKINEDKLIGPFFINPIDLPSSEDNENFKEENDKFIEIFKNKIIMYLFEDVAKAQRRTLFSNKVSNNEYPLYSDICNQFDEKGIEIFCDNIINELRN